MRTLLAGVLVIVLGLSVVACQGDEGPPGPQGPAGDAATIDDATVDEIVERARDLVQQEIYEAQVGAIDRVDEAIHVLIASIPDSGLQARLDQLDADVHTVFDPYIAAAEAAPEGVATFLAMLRTVAVVSNVANAIVSEGLAGDGGAAPPKYEPAEYTKYYVRQAIRMYQTEGPEAVIDYYNSQASVDGQWYMFIADEDDIMVVHPIIPAFRNGPVANAVGPNDYPAGAGVFAVADEDGAWFSYSFTNPATGTVQYKHSWTVRYDGWGFGSGWYERGPAKADAPAYTRAFVAGAIELYNAIGREATVDYYNKPVSVDGQWFAFIIDTETGATIAHYDPAVRNRDPSLRVDARGDFYGDDLLAATQSGRWVDYVEANPETGEDRPKHTWAVLHDGLIFASGWYE